MFVAGLVSSGLDVLIAQGVVAIAGLIVLLRQWREAVRHETGGTGAANVLGPIPGQTKPISGNSSLTDH